MVFMGCLPTFYQNSFRSHLLDFDRGRLLFVYVKFTKNFDRSFTFVYYRKFGKCTTLLYILTCVVESFVSFVSFVS